MTVRQYARHLGVTRQYIYKLISQGKLDYTLIRTYGSIRIDNNARPHKRDIITSMLTQAVERLKRR